MIYPTLLQWVRIRSRGLGQSVAPYSLYFIHRFSDRDLPLSGSIHAFILQLSDTRLVTPTLFITSQMSHIVL